MRSIIIFVLISLVVWGCSKKQVTQTDAVIPPPMEKPDHEVRGYILSPFSCIQENSDSTKSRIKGIMQLLSNSNYNAVFFMVRDNAEVLYSSSMEPWPESLKKEDPGIDPVTFAVTEAHRHGLKFFAGIDLLQLWDTKSLPGNRDHLYFRHGPGIPGDECWICSAPEKPDDSYYLNPALPEVKTYLKNVIRHFIEGYNIDGLYFDFTGYPESLCAEDATTLEKFVTDSLQNPLSRSEWIQQRITDMVEDLVVEAMLVKPYLVNSIVLDGNQLSERQIHWLNRGIVDFVIPEYELDKKQFPENYKNQLDAVNRQNGTPAKIFPCFSIDPDYTGQLDFNKTMNFLIDNSIQGTVWKWSLMDNLKALPIRYPTSIDFPDSLKWIKPDQVIGLDLSKILPEKKSGQTIRLQNYPYSKMTDSEGNIGFIATDPDTLLVGISDTSFVLTTRRWSIPYRYAVEPDYSVSRKEPWVEFRRMPEKITANPSYHLLCKTSYSSTAWINDKSCKVYKTGIFFDEIRLQEGPNRIRASVMTKDSLKVFYEREFLYVKKDKLRNPFPLWIDERSVQPDRELELLPEDVVEFSFQGSRGQSAVAEIQPVGRILPFSRQDFEDYSLYTAALPLRTLASGNTHTISLKLYDLSDSSWQEPCILNDVTSIQVKEPDEFPLVQIIEENTRLTYNLGPVRLGGPIRSELGPGIILKTNGRIGEYYRIRLNRLENGFVHQGDVKVLPREIVQPSYFITSLSNADFHWKHYVNLPVLHGLDKKLDTGILSETRAGGKGRWIFYQVTPDAFDIQEHSYLRRGNWRNTRVIAQLLTNLGVTADVEQVAERLGQREGVYIESRDRSVSADPYRYKNW